VNWISAWGARCAWVILVCASFAWNWHQVGNSVTELARAEARSHFEKDLLYRRWASMHGGVYVPPTSKTPPNPYLEHIPDRDVVTTENKTLTLINPAYMTRQVHELAAEQAGPLGHITSLKPLRPENRPDAWEERALRLFETGVGEIATQEDIDGKPFLRFMRPLIAEESCLKCHRIQGYKVGDIRGGISVSVPFTSFLEIAARQRTHLLAGHGIIGLLGLLGISVAGRKLKESQKDLREGHEILTSILETTKDGFWRLDIHGRLLSVNPAYCRYSGYTREELLQMRITDLEAQESPLDTANHRQRIVSDGSDLFETRHRRKDGSAWPVEVSVSYRPLSGPRGEGEFFVFLRDITSRKEAERELERIAHYDALTGLPNRVLLADRLRHAMVLAQRRQQRLAVVYLDLDGFKEINDEHGHETGDRLLTALGKNMSDGLREGDTLARMGGDEFVAVLLDLAEPGSCVPILDRLTAAVAQPITVTGHAHRVSASLGVTFFPQPDDVDADQLLRQADQAMYQAKLAGKNRYHFFDAEQDRNVRGHHENLEHIRHALANDEFVLHYQPKVNMRTGEVIGAEALIRWQHPQKGLLYPAAFLPIIEAHPLAVGVGEWVIEQALCQMEAWLGTGLNIPVGVNIGAHQLQQPDFVERVRGILAAHPNVAPGMLTMEVLETSALEDLDRISRIIHAFQNLGVKFVLDDFGTGYSSLTYLKRLPVAKLKIDQSFIRDMLNDPDDLAILEGVLGMAAAFHRQVIAEGVETVEHGEILLQLGCELAQGYGIARPMPPGDFPGWAATWRPDPLWRNRSPIKREYLPLLYAMTEHRAWVVAIEDYLNGRREDHPSLEIGECRFGSWLRGNSLHRFSDQEPLQSVAGLHGEIHALAAALCKDHRPRETASVERIGELRSLLDKMLARIKSML